MNFRTGKLIKPDDLNPSNHLLAVIYLGLPEILQLNVPISSRKNW